MHAQNSQDIMTEKRNQERAEMERMIQKEKGKEKSKPVLEKNSFNWWEKYPQKPEILLEKSEIIIPEIQSVDGYKIKYFPDEKACLPNEWARCGIFSASNTLKYVINPDNGLLERYYFVNKKMSSLSENVDIRYTGYDLNQFDLKIWLTAIRESKTQFLEAITSITPYEFCEAAGVPRGGKSSALVYDSLNRLFHGNLSSEMYKVEKGKKILVRSYHDHLINNFSTNKDTDKWEIALSAKFAVMYLFQTTWVEWDTYKGIRSDMMRALILQICSHEAHPDNPQRIGLQKLRELLRVDSPNIELRRLIKINMAKIKALGIVDSWSFENDILMFTRPKH